MTHIIQSPKPRNQGATFADVPIAADKNDMRALFLNGAGCILQRCGKREAREFGLERRYEYGLGDQATPLSVQPIDPEPDPDVCTYGELRIGETFAFSDELGALLRRTDEGHVYIGCGQHYSHRPDGTSVRRVSASVVEHEEPGTPGGRGQVEVADEPGNGVFLHGHHYGETIWADEEIAGRLIRQLAAWLAQQAASPESDDVSACGVCSSDESCDCECPDADALPSCLKPEPAEDRSKPAPGYTVRHVVNRWVLERPGTPFFLKDSSKTFLIRRSWAQHDAQQAGEGGGS